MTWTDTLFSADGFMPHGHCYLWEPHILWLHVASDALIGLSYFSIPLVLMLFSRKRGDLKLNSIFYALSSFILACGLTHFFSIIVIWHRLYLPEGLLKALTAAISAITASALWLILPKLLAVPSPAKLAAVNAALNEEIRMRWEMDRQITTQNIELRASNRELAMREYALAQAVGAIAMADMKANITYCNHAFATLLGVDTTEELVGRNALDFMPEGGGALGTLVQEGRWLGEIDIVRPDGTIRDAAVAANMVKFDDDHPSLIIASFLDITDARHARTALRESEARLANAQRIARLGHWDWNIAEERVSWSEETFRIFDVRPEAGPLGLENMLEAVHPDDRDTVRQAVQRCMAPGNGAASWSFRLVRPSGEIRHATSQAEASFNETGTPVRISGTIQDITEQKQLEQQFLQAQKMETVGHLTGGVAHDFNNVLMAMQLNLEVVEERVRDDEEASECVRVALGAVQRGADLTNRLLAFSRRQPLQPREVNVNVLVREMMRLLHRALQEVLDVETVLAAGIWSIEVDPAQLENALINLAVNARDAMPDGGKLTIETANTRLDDEYARAYDEVKAGQYVMIAVTDTGIGMTPAVMDRAFDPFFTTKDVGKGSGLGLSMVYGFVKQSGGHVKLYSEQGQGTTVKLYFPRVMSSGKPWTVEQPRDIPAGRGVILVVEDDSAVRRSVAQSLESAGYSVHAAEAGAEAVALVEQGLRPDLLLADVVLPRGMSGKDVSAAVTALASNCRTLYMSGYTDNAIVHQGRLDPGVVLISRPFARQALAAKIREVLEH